jgi:hypothetical protein
MENSLAAPITKKKKKMRKKRKTEFKPQYHQKKKKRKKERKKSMLSDLGIPFLELSQGNEFKVGTKIKRCL